MEIRILEERKNPLLKRVEYVFEVSHGASATPNRDSVRQELAKVAHVPKDRLVVERLNAKFGIAKSEGLAAAYESKEALTTTVREHILVRNGFKEKAPKPGSTPSPEATSPAPTKVEAPPPLPTKEG